jgi:hypothetical protein
MTISMYDASVPVFRQMMETLSIILDKAQKHAMSNNIAPETLLQARLFPDMYDLIRQIQMASDFAKAVSARLANLEVPSYPDNETNFQELQQRVEKTVQFLASIPRERIEGSEEREIVVRAGTPREKRYVALPYLLHHGLPQFFFHVTVAYAILRSIGVEIGKTDYMGRV